MDIKDAATTPTQQFPPSANGIDGGASARNSIATTPKYTQLRSLIRDRERVIQARNKITNVLFSLVDGATKEERGANLKTLLKKAKKLYKEDPNYFDGLPYGWVSVIVNSAIVFDQTVKDIEREVVKLVRQHPLWSSWGENKRGVGEIVFAQIIGEAGDVSAYKSPRKLYRRFGLGVMNDKAQGHPDVGSVDEVGRKEVYILAGYSKYRRKIMYLAVDAQIKTTGHFKPVYDEHKEREQVKLGEGERGAHMRAHRRCAQGMLKDLWVTMKEKGSTTHGT